MSHVHFWVWRPSASTLLTLSFGDTLGLSDSLGKELRRALADSYGISDEVGKRLDARISDLLNSSDDRRSTVDYHTIEDAVLLVDTPAVSTQFPVSDVVTLSDGYTLSVLRDPATGPKAVVVRRLHPTSRYYIMVSADTLEALAPASRDAAANPVVETFLANPNGTLRLEE